MGAALFAFANALLIFALSAEADSQWLITISLVVAVYFVIAGAYVGWQTTRKR